MCLDVYVAYTCILAYIYSGIYMLHMNTLFTCVQMCGCLLVYISACVYLLTYVPVHICYTYVQVFTCLHMCRCLCLHMCRCLYVCICAGVYCEAFWDTLKCWPRTAVNTTVRQTCPEIYVGQVDIEGLLHTQQLTP